MNPELRPPIGDPDCHLCHGQARGCDCPCVMVMPTEAERDRREVKRRAVEETRELKGADLWRAAFGTDPPEKLTIDAWRDAILGVG